MDIMSIPERIVRIPVEDLIPRPPPPFAATLDSSTTVNPTFKDDAQNGLSLPFEPSYQQALESLPTLVERRGHGLFFANVNISTFLRIDLDLSRLNRIHDHLWLAGIPMRTGQLHSYRLKGYEILGTQQMDLHLTLARTPSQKLLVKPLPYWIFCHEFWSKHICREVLLWQSAAGLLLSYTWLITTPLDLQIAQDLTLLPKTITWRQWKLLISSFGENIDINTYQQVNKRYHFGDLRIDRLNFIYRIRYFRTHFLIGYLYRYHTYTPFFERKFAWALIPFGVFLTVILSAMQVGISLPALGNNPTFLHASSGFVIFSMTCMLVVVSSVIIYHIFFVIVAFTIVVSYTRREQRRRVRRARRRAESNA